MRGCSNILRVMSALVAALVALILGVGCTTADDMLGADFIPDNQKMQIRRAIFDKTNSEGRRMMVTKMFRTDSIVASNLKYGYIGAQNHAEFGKRKAGFISQYLVVGLSDSTGFGYRPIFDSAQILLTVSEFGGDTLQPQRYNVYEVTRDFVSENKNANGEVDSTFYLTYDVTPYINPEPVFTFTFPDGVTTGPATTAVTMQPTEAGMSLINRLMLVEGDYRDQDMSVYKDDEKWVKYFKGLYIAPDGEPSGEGSIYSLDLETSGFTIFGRNRHESDPELIKDTTQAVYYFLDDAAEWGNISVNTIERDYTGTNLSDEEMLEADEMEQDNRPEVEIGYVEGMGGPVMEIAFTKEFFRALEELCVAEDPATGEMVEYDNIAFNQVRMLIYVDGSSYDWEEIVPDDITPLLNESFARLGLYTDYKSLTPIPDYNYVYEANYSLELNYGGYLSRSLGCYELDITAYVQSLWNKYRDLPRGDRAKGDVSSIEERIIYLAPEAYGLYGFDRAIVQGAQMEDGTIAAPIKTELTYTLIK